MLRDDVIIPTAIVAHSERSTQFTQTAFVCLGRNSLSGYCQVLDRPLLLFLTREAFECVLGNPHGKFCVSLNAIEVDLELT